MDGNDRRSGKVGIGKLLTRFTESSADRQMNPFKMSFLHITAPYPYVWQIPGKLKEAVIQDHGNTEYDGCSTQYDNYISKYSGDSKDDFSLHYITFPGKGGVQGVAMPFKQKALGYPITEWLLRLY